MTNYATLVTGHRQIIHHSWQGHNHIRPPSSACLQPWHWDAYAETSRWRPINVAAETTVKLLATGRGINRENTAQAAVIPMIESIRRTQRTKRKRARERGSILQLGLGLGLGLGLKSCSWLQANWRGYRGNRCAQEEAQEELNSSWRKNLLSEYKSNCIVRYGSKTNTLTIW